jgi:DNA-binding MurR/RpiR family transcriptional regulator
MQQKDYKTMTEKNIIKQIRSLKKMTPSELKIAEYFSSYEHELAFENVTSISKNTGVSKSTVVRFLSRLGYKKFADFRKKMRNDLVTKRESLRYLLQKKQLENRQEDILGENFSYIMKNLQYTHAKIDPQKFLNVAQILMQSGSHLYITGQRTSYPLAYLFHMLITRLRPGATLLGPEISMFPDKMTNVSADDLLLSIFRQPYGKQTLKISQYFAEKNARIILITDSEFSPASELATIQLTVPSEGLSIFRSFAAVTALLESLNIAALKFCGEEMINNLQKGEKLLGDFEVFCPRKGIDISQIQKLKDIQNRQ